MKHLEALIKKNNEEGKTVETRKFQILLKAERRRYQMKKIKKYIGKD